MTQPKPIKASLGFKKLSPRDVLTRANAVLEGVYTAKEDYPHPPVEEAMLKTQVDALSAGITAALDGGKKAVAAREHLKETVSSRCVYSDTTPRRTAKTPCRHS